MGGPTFNCKTAPSPSTITTPYNTPIPRPTPCTHQAKRHPNPISRFVTVYFPDQPTDRQRKTHRLIEWDKHRVMSTPIALTLKMPWNRWFFHVVLLAFLPFNPMLRPIGWRRPTMHCADSLHAASKELPVAHNYIRYRLIEVDHSVCFERTAGGYTIKHLLFVTLDLCPVEMT